MKIFRNNIEIYDLPIDEKTVITRRLSVENTLSVEHESPAPLVLAIGDYVTIGDERYVIGELPPYTLTGGLYKYNILLQGWLHTLEYLTMPDQGRDEFYYFGTLHDHIDYLLSVLNGKSPGWTAVKPSMAAISTTPRNINYAGCSLLGAISKLCNKDEGFDIEFNVTGQEIVFAKAIRRETALAFEYGYNKGLYKIAREKLKNGKVFTRFYGYGGTTNMLDNQRLSFDGKYIEKNIALYGLRETTVKFDDIYPRRNGKITRDAAIVAEGKANWTVADSTLDFDLNGQIVEGAVIAFNTGDCAGNEFEIISYDPDTKVITFKEYSDTSQSPAYVLPSAVRYPRANDEYFFKNIIMPESYLIAAKAELKQAVQEYADKNCVPKHPYTIDCDPRYIKRLEFVPQVGDVVKVIDTPLGLEASIRITAVEFPVLSPYKVKLTISEDIIISTAILQEINTKKNKEKLEIIDRRAEVSARKQSKALTELENYLLDTEGYFNSDKFKALSIEARMLAVGLQSQNFTLSGIRVTPNSGNLTTVVVTAGTLTHASLEVAGLGSTWAITGKTLSAPDTSKAYYIYAKCSKITLSGTIEISETELKVEQFPNYYVFNLGVLYPQRAGESWRDYSATYGVTSVVGDQIYGGGIKALDGFNFVDLRAAAENGRFRLGSRTKGSIDYGVTEPDTLTLSNVKLVSRGGHSSCAPVYRGTWTNAELYYAGETISYQGSMYQCKQDCPTAGILPINTTYWYKTVSKGDTGAIDEEILNNLNNKIDGIQIGGVNLLPKSQLREDQGLFVANQNVTLSNPDFDGLQVYSNQAESTPGIKLKRYDFIPLGKIYTVSFDVKGVGGITKMSVYHIGTPGSATERRDVMNITDAWQRKSVTLQNTTISLFAFLFSNTAVGQGFVIRNVKIELGNKATDWSPAQVDVDEAISNAEQAGTDAQATANTLKNFTDQAFNDGVISRAEAAAIEKYKNSVMESFNDLQNSYYVVYNNTYLLAGTTKNNLAAALTGLNTCKNNLLSSITSAIADGKTTTAEKVDVDSKYSLYTSAVGTFKTALEQANKAIQERLDSLSSEKIDNIQVGGRNLLINSHVEKYSKNEAAGTEHMYYADCHYIFKDRVGKSVMISFDCKVDRPGSVRLYATNISRYSFADHIFNATTEYKRYAFLCTIQDRQNASLESWIEFYGTYNTGRFVWVKNVKIEDGNKATAWTPAPEDVQAAAVEKSAKELGFTKIEGGLIQSNLIKLSRIGGQETAGISGIDTDSQGASLPVFYAGGTYQQALLRQANVDIYHSGKSKLGRMFVNEDGSSIYKDSSNIDRIFITPEDISTLTDLTGSSQVETGVDTPASNRGVILGSYSEAIPLGSLTVTKNNADLFIKNIPLRVYIRNYTPVGDASARINLHLLKDGNLFAYIDTLAIEYRYGRDEADQDLDVERTITATLKVPKGVYQLMAYIDLSSTSDLISASYSIGQGRFMWQYLANISKSELGQNGYLMFKDIKNFFYSAVEGGKLNLVCKTEGTVDMPGTLVAYSVRYDGNITRRWGGKVAPINTHANRVSTGVYDVPHQIGHTDYIVTVTCTATGGSYFCLVRQKGTNSVRIEIRGMADNPSNQDFDIVITGRNT